MLGESVSHFKITGKLGEGGMGEVWRADDTKLGRQVALKVLPPAFAADAERMGRFEREAQVLASLNHPNIAAIYGLEETEGRRALVMELVEGETLGERIERGALSLDEALKIALQIAGALEAAHEKGIIHRDLKPANVKIAPDGTVKVLDFGLAKALEEEHPSQDMANSPTLTAAATQAGIILGTAAYMSPEQAAGQLADRRADVWSFGVVLLEMLTGNQQFAGETVSHTLAAVLQKDPDWDELPADLPPPIVDLVQHCLRKDFKSRLQAIGDARVLLEDYLADPDAHQGLAAAPPVAVTPMWKRALPWGVAAALAAGLIAVLVVGSREVASPRPVKRLEVAVADQSAWVQVGSSVILSPDERYMSVVVGQGDMTNLLLRPLDQFEASPVAGGTGSTGASAYHPFFSPDGNWLGFVSPSELKKVPVSGGTPIVLCAVGRSRGASWSPDGTIVFAGDPATGLSVVPEAGGSPQPLTTLDADKGEVSHRWPQVLPGAKAVLFTSQVENAESYDQANIEVLILSSKERRVVARGGSYGRYVSSGHLVYLNNGTLFGIPFDLETLETVGTAAPLVQGVVSNPGEGGAHYSVSDAGTLAYIGGEVSLPVYPIQKVNPEGAITTLWSLQGTYGGPRFSPDGKKLALRDDNWDVWVFDLEREVPTRLTFHDGYDGDAIWSPDGSTILFSSNREGKILPFRKRADGSGEAEKLIDYEEDLYSTSFSPDGKLLIGETLGYDLWFYPIEGGELELFLKSEFQEGTAKFSPDGRWVAYHSNESGRSEIYVRPFPAAGGKWQVSDEGGGFPTWSGDGRSIFYRTDEGIMTAAVEAEGGTFRVDKPKLLFDGSFRGGAQGMAVLGYAFPDYDVSAATGDFVMFPESEQEGRGAHVNLVLNWGEELLRTLPPEKR
jgi:serine/threonine-protein kinase